MTVYVPFLLVSEPPLQLVEPGLVESDLECEGVNLCDKFASDLTLSVQTE